MSLRPICVLIFLASLVGLTHSVSAQNPTKTKTDPKTKVEPKEQPKTKFNTDITIDKISLGKQLSGPKVTKDDLKGKVVLFDMWGIHCAPCLEAMPRTAALYRELGDFGFVVLGSHSQPGTVDEIMEVANGRGATFPILTNAGVGGTNDNNALPHVVLFDHTGKCVFRGRPDEADEKIRPLVGEMIVANAEQDKFNSTLAPITAELKKGRSPSSLIPRLSPLLVSANKETAAQSQALVGSITASGKIKLDEAKEKASDSPVEAFLLVEKLPVSYKGTPVGKQAAELIEKLKKEKAVAMELAARPSLESIKQMIGKFGNADPSKPEFRKANSIPLKALENKLAQMKKSWPDATATSDASKLAEKYLTK